MTVHRRPPPPAQQFPLHIDACTLKSLYFNKGGNQGIEFLFIRDAPGGMDERKGENKFEEKNISE